MGAAAPITRSTPPSFQMVGMARRRRPKPQARSAVREEPASRKPAFAFRWRVPDKGGSRRKSGTPTARRPYHLFSTGAAAPIARRAPPGRSPMEGRPPCRPKPQARSAVCEEHANFGSRFCTKETRGECRFAFQNKRLHFMKCFVEFVHAASEATCSVSPRSCGPGALCLCALGFGSGGARLRAVGGVAIAGHKSRAVEAGLPGYLFLPRAGLSGGASTFPCGSAAAGW